MSKPVLNQINVVCGDVEASLTFYRRLGVDIPDGNVWRTPTGAHHVNAGEQRAELAAHFDLDSIAFAQKWNPGWVGRPDLKGRVVVGFGVSSREAVDDIFRDMTGAGYLGLQPPHNAFWGARYAILEDPDGVAVGIMSPISPDRKSAPPDV